MLRRLYNACIEAAGKPYATWALGTVSFTESSFFPVPPDVMLVPMALAHPKRAYYYAMICTLTSVAGGIFGYIIGAFLYDSVGLWLISLYGYGDKVEAFRQAYAEWGTLVVLINGFTPIPYKIATITSGFAGYNFFLFVLFSFLTRGARFFLTAFLLNRYGEQVRNEIEKRLVFWTIAFLIVFFGGFIVILTIL